MPSSRQFNIVMPSDDNFHGLYDLMLGVTGAVPADGILPKSVSNVNIFVSGATAINIADNNFANNTGDTITPVSSPNWYKQSNRNVIYLPDYKVKGNAATFSIDIFSF